MFGRRAAPAIALLVATGAFAPSARALTYENAGELRDDCAAIPRMLRGERTALTAAGECLAFIDGARAFARTIEIVHHRAILCVPEDVTTVDLAGLFVQAIDRMPNRRSEPAAAELYATLSAAFPCKA